MKDSTLFRGKIDLAHKISGFRDARTTGKANVFGVFHAGNTPQHLGIFDNDLLVVETKSEYKAGDNKLYILETPNGRTAKFIEESADETLITLSNQADWRQTWQQSGLGFCQLSHLLC